MNTATDPLKLLRSLDADALQARLDALQAEADALRVLLRSARARERHQRDTVTDRKEVRRAD